MPNIKKSNKKFQYRLITYDGAGHIHEIVQFDANERKDGFSKPLKDFLWAAFIDKPEGGKIEIDKGVWDD